VLDDVDDDGKLRPENNLEREYHVTAPITDANRCRS
jgi:hypothetical protein